MAGELTQAEREALWHGLAVPVHMPDPNDDYMRVGHLDDLTPVVESILAARLAPLETELQGWRRAQQAWIDAADAWKERAERAEAALARVEAQWSEGNPNDGTYEYVATSDCDGSNMAFFRRLPPLHARPGNWEPCDGIPDAALYPEQARALAGGGQEGEG